MIRRQPCAGLAIRPAVPAERRPISVLAAATAVAMVGTPDVEGTLISCLNDTDAETGDGSYGTMRALFDKMGMNRKDKDLIDLLGRLTPLHIPVSGFLLHPVVGFTSMRPAFQRAEWEVARIIEAPVSVLSDTAAIKREIRNRIVRGQSIDVDVPYFDIDGEKVWGATAMVLAEFCAILTT